MTVFYHHYIKIFIIIDIIMLYVSKKLQFDILQLNTSAKRNSIKDGDVGKFYPSHDGCRQA